MNAFLTGSHVYGEPHAKSDIDLVVRMTGDEFIKLAELVGKCDDCTVSVPHSFQFGKLNLIVCSDDEEVKKWWDAREICKSKKPCSREKAIKIHNLTGATGHE